MTHYRGPTRAGRLQVCCVLHCRGCRQCPLGAQPLTQSSWRWQASRLSLSVLCLHVRPCHAGPAVHTCSSLFSSEDFQRWRGAFYERLQQHVTAASQSIGEAAVGQLVCAHRTWEQQRNYGGGWVCGPAWQGTVSSASSCLALWEPLSAHDDCRPVLYWRQPRPGQHPSGLAMCSVCHVNFTTVVLSLSLLLCRLHVWQLRRASPHRIHRQAAVPRTAQHQCCRAAAAREGQGGLHSSAAGAAAAGHAAAWLAAACGQD